MKKEIFRAKTAYVPEAAVTGHVLRRGAFRTSRGVEIFRWKDQTGEFLVAIPLHGYLKINRDVDLGWTDHGYRVIPKGSRLRLVGRGNTLLPEVEVIYPSN